MPIPEPTMGGEDMAYFLREVPGTFFFLGSRPQGPSYPQHNPKFDIDEDTLWLGTALLSETAWRWLETQQHPPVHAGGSGITPEHREVQASKTLPR